MYHFPSDSYFFDIFTFVLSCAQVPFRKSTFKS
eukprot:UN16261